MAVENMKRNKTMQFIYNVSELIYLCAAPYYWCEELKLPKTVIKFYDVFSKFIDILVNGFILTEWAAFFTQKHLTEKQSADRALLSFSHPILQSFVYNLAHHRDKVRRVLQILTTELKEIYNDIEIERQMITQAKIHSGAYASLFSLTLFFYGINGLTDTTFTTIIPAWPDVEDRSPLAGFFRVVWYIIWWIFMIRVSTVYTLLITLTICLSYQFKQLQSYFLSLNKIFNGGVSSEKEKEKEYETAFNVGIKLHSRTLWCTKEVQEISGVVFGGQIIMNTTVLVLLMSQMVNSERTLSNIVATVTTIITMLISTGFFMWCAGDVTVEKGNIASSSLVEDFGEKRASTFGLIVTYHQAAQLPLAIFGSGWQHCRRDASKKIRPLLVIAMSRSQTPVELECLGIVKLSYSAYVSIVKSTYSVFSMIYST